MRYDEEKNIITVHVRELVSSARRRICTALPTDIDEPENIGVPKRIIKRIIGKKQSTTLTYPFHIDTYNAEIKATPLALSENELYFIIAVDSSVRRPKKK